MTELSRVFVLADPLVIYRFLSARFLRLSSFSASIIGFN